MIRPFIDTFRHVDQGQLLEDLSDLQNKIVQAVSENRKGGEIKITLRYKPNGNQVKIFSNVEHKIPQPDRAESMFFVTPEFNLSREDPYQQSLEGIEPVTDNRKPKEVNNG